MRTLNVYEIDSELYYRGIICALHSPSISEKLSIYVFINIEGNGVFCTSYNQRVYHVHPTCIGHVYVFLQRMLLV